MSTARRIAAAVLAAGAASAGVASPGTDGRWQFKVLLDGKPIGEHRFSVGGSQTRIEASFDVKFLGITAYRYRHQASERWEGDCLTGLTAQTDDDGKPSTVKAQRQDGRLLVTSPRGERSEAGCVMTFAYWNPAMLRQTRLLNPQTGQLVDVQITRVDDGTVEVHGQPTPARHWRVTGPEQPIDVWYSPEGEWLALDSTVAGNRKLSYRLP